MQRKKENKRPKLTCRQLHVAVKRSLSHQGALLFNSAALISHRRSALQNSNLFLFQTRLKEKYFDIIFFCGKGAHSTTIVYFYIPQLSSDQ